MYPRLEILRDLLAEDGSIWVFIDGNEGQYLKVLMDEVFGRKNFIPAFIWEKVDSPNNNKVPITPDHEYIFCYAKTLAKQSSARKATGRRYSSWQLSAIQEGKAFSSKSMIR